MLKMIGWKIIINPAMTDGDDGGNYLYYQDYTWSAPKQIQSVIIKVSDNVHLTTIIPESPFKLPDISSILSGRSSRVEEMEVNPSVQTGLITVGAIRLRNDLSQFSLVESEIEININDNQYLESPYRALFRKGDIIKFAYFYGEIPGEQQYVLTGQITKIVTGMSRAGITLRITVSSMTSILAKSAAVQFEGDWNSKDFKIITVAAKRYKMGEIIKKFIDETALAKIAPEVIYQKSDGETPAATAKMFINPSFPAVPVSKGTALNENSIVFIYVNPSSSKLDSILQVLYIYQRVIYCDVDGKLVITPLSTELDKDWLIDISGANGESAIPAINSSHVDNMLDTNRVFMPFCSASETFNTSKDVSNNTAKAPQSIAIPGEEFKRESDIARSRIGTRTEMLVNSISTINVQNSSFLNIATGLEAGEMSGLKSHIYTGSNNSSITDPEGNILSNYSNIMAANKMAEHLFKAEQWEVKVPLVCTYDQIEQRLFTIPLNKTIIFDRQKLFCYGWNLDWGIHGTVLTLKLCRPYTFRALWGDKVT